MSVKRNKKFGETNRDSKTALKDAHIKLGISEKTYLYRKERYDNYQSTMFQV